MIRRLGFAMMMFALFSAGEAGAQQSEPRHRR